MQFYDTINAGGSTIGSIISTTSGDGYEAYSLFVQGVNDTLPFKNRDLPTFLLTEKNPGTGSADDDFFIYAPTLISGYVAVMSSTGITSYVYYRAEDTFVIYEGITCMINRIDCTKYGQGNKITFINKYGVLQDLWFFLKKVKNINRSNESYQSNTLTMNGDDALPSYSQTNAPTRIFNTRAKQSHSLSSGYYPEYANSYFEELLLSEYVWLTRIQENAPNTPEIVPVVIKTSDMTYKTSLNDRLIEYTIEFQDAFDYINNVR